MFVFAAVNTVTLDPTFTAANVIDWGAAIGDVVNPKTG